MGVEKMANKEIKVILSADAKEVLVNAGRIMNLNQSAVIENLLINFHKNKMILENIGYAEKQEKVLKSFAEKIQQLETEVEFLKNNKK